MIIWENIYSVQVAEIDEQHKRFIIILNELYDAISSSQLKEKIEHIFSGLSDYATFHFATEEKYFDQFNYEGSAEHKAKHEEFRKIIADYEKKIKSGETEWTTNLVEFLDNWLVDHVLTMDKKYVICFKEHGLK